MEVSYWFLVPGVYYCFNMVIIMLSIFLSSVVININRRGDALQPLPPWLRKVSTAGYYNVKPAIVFSFTDRIRHRPVGSGTRQSPLDITLPSNLGKTWISRHARHHIVLH